MLHLYYMGITFSVCCLLWAMLATVSAYACSAFRYWHQLCPLLNASRPIASDLQPTNEAYGLSSFHSHQLHSPPPTSIHYILPDRGPRRRLYAKHLEASRCYRGHCPKKNSKQISRLKKIRNIFNRNKRYHLESKCGSFGEFHKHTYRQFKIVDNPGVIRFRKIIPMNHDILSPAKDGPSIVVSRWILNRVNDVCGILLILGDLTLMIVDNLSDAIAQNTVHLWSNVCHRQSEAFGFNERRLNVDQQLRIWIFVFSGLCLRHIKLEFAPSLVRLIPIHVRENLAQTAARLKIHETAHWQSGGLWIDRILAQFRLLILNELDQ